MQYFNDCKSVRTNMNTMKNKSLYSTDEKKFFTRFNILHKISQIRYTRNISQIIKFTYDKSIANHIKWHGVIPVVQYETDSIFTTLTPNSMEVLARVIREEKK